MLKSCLKNLPKHERPRERLIREGSEALSLSEIIAILLATGTKGKSVLSLAQEMLSHFGDLQGLLEASIAELEEIKGIGRAKAVQLKAAFALALRLSKNTADKYSIEAPSQVFELVKEELSHQKQEVLMVILRDVRGRIFHKEKVSIGTLSEVLIHPREVFYPAVKHKAHSLIIAHNHPSGDPTPSQADLDLTRLLLQSSRIMGIYLDDHLIIGSETFVSLREKGLMGLPPKY